MKTEYNYIRPASMKMVYGIEILLALVNITNPKSAKILAKFMIPVREFFNENDSCIDRRYLLKRVDWSK